MTRYPFAPLEALLRVSLRPELNGAGQPASLTRRMAAVFGCDPAQIARWRRYGLLQEQAEKGAVDAGVTPWEVWDDWGQRACDDCGSRFIPLRRDARFCSRPCYRRWWARDAARKRRARPDLAERNRARRRAYYAENGAYERSRERRRYQAKKAA